MVLFFSDAATTGICTLSRHGALPIGGGEGELSEYGVTVRPRLGVDVCGRACAWVGVWVGVGARVYVGCRRVLGEWRSGSAAAGGGCVWALVWVFVPL